MTRTTRSKYNRWWRHAPKWFRKAETRAFRKREKQYFKKFGEILIRHKYKNWYW